MVCRCLQGYQFYKIVHTKTGDTPYIARRTTVINLLTNFPLTHIQKYVLISRVTRKTQILNIEQISFVCCSQKEKYSKINLKVTFVFHCCVGENWPIPVEQKQGSNCVRIWSVDRARHKTNTSKIGQMFLKNEAFLQYK